MLGDSEGWPQEAGITARRIVIREAAARQTSEVARVSDLDVRPLASQAKGPRLGDAPSAHKGNAPQRNCHQTQGAWLRYAKGDRIHVEMGRASATLN